MKIVILNNCALHSRYFRNAVNIRHTEPGYGYRGFVYFGQEKDIIVTCQHRTILEQDILSENF